MFVREGTFDVCWTSEAVGRALAEQWIGLEDITAAAEGTSTDSTSREGTSGG